MNFIGIDLGWKREGSTALVALNGRGMITASAYEREDEGIISFLESHAHNGCLVGVDAPLVVKNSVGHKGCEKQLQRLGVPSYPANRGWLTKVFSGVRGELLVSKMAEIGIELRDQLAPRAITKAVMEVYPYATLRILLDTLPSYKNGTKAEKLRGMEKLRQLLARLHPPLVLPESLVKPYEKFGLKELKKAEDFLDAAVAAYTVYLYWIHGTERSRVIGDKTDGFIQPPQQL